MDRAEPRNHKLVFAHLTSERLPSHRVIVTDLSENGVSLRSEGELPLPGERVAIDFGSGDVKLGVVRWINGPKVGISLSAMKPV
jgi:hypothetical protein